MEVYEKRQSETYQKDAKANYDNLMTLCNLLPCGILWYTLGDDPIIRHLNKKSVEILGYTSVEEFVKKGDAQLLNYIHPDDVERFIKKHDNLTREGDSAEISFQAKNKFGDAIWLKGNVQRTVFLPGGVMNQFIYEDITELKETKYNTEQIEASYDTLIDSIPGGVSVYEMYDGKIHNTFMNDMAARIVGYTKEELHELLKDNGFSKIHPSDIVMVQDNLEKSIESGSVVDSICRILCKNQMYRWVHISAKAVRGNGKKTLVYVIILDLEQEKKQEEELNQIKNNMKALIGALPGGYGIFRVSDTVGTQYLTENIENLLGYEKGERIRLTSDNAVAYVHPDDENRIEKAIRLAVMIGTKFDETFRVQKRDGTYVAFRVCAHLSGMERNHRIYYATFSLVGNFE